MIHEGDRQLREDLDEQCRVIITRTFRSKLSDENKKDFDSLSSDQQSDIILRFSLEPYRIKEKSLKEEQNEKD